MCNALNTVYVPPDDMARFGRLSAAARDEINLWCNILSEFNAAPNKAAAIVELKAKYGHLAKITRSSVYRHLERHRTQGWIGLAHKNRLKKAGKKLPQAFIDFWQVLCEENQRKIAPAYRSLFEDHLIAGKTIPGYGTWETIWLAEHPGWSLPPSCPYHQYSNTPAGWSYRTLHRHAPESYQLVAARIGTGAASHHLPSVLSTRVGLAAGQYYVVDDMFHDIKVNFVGNRAAQIPLELGALDLYTGHYVTYGIKPVRERDDGTKEHLKEDYMRYLLAHLFCRIGIHPGGCTILGEHGTAKVTGDLLEACNRWGGGNIKFEAGGIQGAPIAKGLYEGRPRGNSRFKAALESHHNLKHNELAALTGQRGKDRDSSPAEIYGRDKENNALTKALIALEDSRPDLIEQLRRPYMSFFQFSELLTILYDRIARRTHHNLEGFEEAGLVVQEFRLAEGLPWMPISQLDKYDPQQRAAIETVISRPGMIQLRRMSPLEAWNAESRNLVKLPDCAVPDILGPNLGSILTVNKEKCLVAKDPEIPGRQYTYIAIAKDSRGREIDLPRKSKFLVHVSPFDTSEAYISTVDGQFIGKADCMQRAARDSELMRENLGKLQHIQARELKKLAPFANKKLKERYEATAANVKALTGKDPVAEAEEDRRHNRQIMRKHITDDDISAAVNATSPGNEDADELSLDEIAELIKDD